jgi:hypothetical protein
MMATAFFLAKPLPLPSTTPDEALADYLEEHGTRIEGVTYLSFLLFRWVDDDWTAPLIPALASALIGWVDRYPHQKVITLGDGLITSFDPHTPGALLVVEGGRRLLWDEVVYFKEEGIAIGGVGRMPVEGDPRTLTLHLTPDVACPRPL